MSSPETPTPTAETPEVVDIAEEQIPLGDVPYTGDSAVKLYGFAATAIGSALGLFVLLLKGRREDEDAAK